jgi:beta-glucanase (GH16 family)
MTALADKDFIPASGVVTIPAGSITATVDIVVKGDSVRKDAQTFELIFSNPKNCTLTTTSAIGKILNDNGLYFVTDNTGYSTPVSYSGYMLTWNDEFDSRAISEDNWTFEIGNNNGWGNHELENYTGRTQNAFVSNGNLIIEAHQESFGGFNFTSSRMISKAKKTFQYGRVDIRAKLPKGKGIWPALWMLGSNIDQVGWPACGEIDILEMLGQDPTKIYGTLHYGSSTANHQQNGSTYTLGTGSFDQQFHVFSLVWEKDLIKILVDDTPYLSVAGSTISGVNPFDNAFFFIFNVAVGGDFPGNPDSTTSFPQRMIVDYIRVFQQ